MHDLRCKTEEKPLCLLMSPFGDFKGREDEGNQEITKIQRDLSPLCCAVMHSDDRPRCFPPHRGTGEGHHRWGDPERCVSEKHPVTKTQARGCPSGRGTGSPGDTGPTPGFQPRAAPSLAGDAARIAPTPNPSRPVGAEPRRHLQLPAALARSCPRRLRERS